MTYGIKTNSFSQNETSPKEFNGQDFGTKFSKYVEYWSWYCTGLSVTIYKFKSLKF